VAELVGGGASRVVRDGGAHGWLAPATSAGGRSGGGDGAGGKMQ
jgi:hypothetical protein